MFSLKRMGTFIDLRGDRIFSTWLVSIAINEALMRIRSRRPPLFTLDLLNSEARTVCPSKSLTVTRVLSVAT